ncbi:hypothetical protein [Flavobacterium aciduliphilum]|uniref:PAP2 superfamily protein n=1 Tax=Flavobacterium aciduliphilum TaxID=1101402 RepID=A0A328YFR5_9FLAO|nr:hypothetical protein [Flavobacterium aciduliphilum]RAR72779.1 hypothetical protein CLV55_10438 [Flavobacterium aciduliphilum]
MRKFILLFSYLFHPVFIPTFGTLFYVFLSDNYLIKEQYTLLLIQVFMLTVLMPLTFFYVFKALGKIDSVMVSNVSQRKIPLVMQLCLTEILLYKSVTLDRYFELFFFFLGGMGSMFAAFGLIFAQIKASLHMLAMSSLTFFVMGLMHHYQINGVYTLATLMVLCGIVASSRLEMKAHTFEELALGFVLGMMPQVVLWIFWL